MRRSLGFDSQVQASAQAPRLAAVAFERDRRNDERIDIGRSARSRGESARFARRFVRPARCGRRG